MRGNARYLVSLHGFVAQNRLWSTQPDLGADPMRIGVPKEIKNHEYRVGLTPPSVAELVAAGHQVVVETGAGKGIDFEDQDYIEAGAAILPHADAVFEHAQMIVKVKEPQAVEIARLRPDHLLFTYLHL